MPEIVERTIDTGARDRLVAAGIDPRLARIFAARGVVDAEELGTRLATLVAPERLNRVEEAARHLADAIAKGEKLLIVADYDADGATACAVGMKALRAMGAKVDYIVPNRFEHSYGLTPEIVLEAAERSPDWLITVDNGIAAVDGIEAANRLGMRVLVTDHHLPGARLPDAACIVNPNQAGCGFPSKHLAGVGVIFYVMLALRAELRRRNAFPAAGEPPFGDLLDLVALGTVADVARLDANNRTLVSQGIARIRAGRASPGIAALIEVAGREPRRASAYDLGFVVGPRLNAAGRLDDMSVGIECLLAEDRSRALVLAQKLDALNRERREIESDMQESALASLDLAAQDGYSIVVHQAEWHAGVVGILASRLRERFHRPVFAFARDNEGLLRGSGRSIAALHLRDALDLVDKRTPGILARFGGHAAAAGATISPESLETFRDSFEAVARERLTPGDLDERVETDGALVAADFTESFAEALRAQVWGQGFPEPRFRGSFRVESQKIVGEKHLKLALFAEDRRVSAMRFGSAEPLPESIDAIYRLDVNEYQGLKTLQVIIERTV